MMSGERRAFAPSRVDVRGKIMGLSRFFTCIGIIAALTSPAWAVERLAYLLEKDRAIWVEDIDGGNKKLLATGVGDHTTSYLDISPDYKTILVWGRPGDTRLYLMDMSTAKVQYVKPANEILGKHDGVSETYEFLDWGDKPNEFLVVRHVTREKSGGPTDGGLFALDLDTLISRRVLSGDPYRSVIMDLFRSPDGSMLALHGENWVHVLDTATHRPLYYITDSMEYIEPVWKDDHTLMVRFGSYPGEGPPKKPVLVDFPLGKARRWPYPQLDLRNVLFCGADPDMGTIWSLDQNSQDFVTLKTLNLKTGKVTTERRDSSVYWSSERTESGYETRLDFVEKDLWVVNTATGKKRLAAKGVLSRVAWVERN